MVPNLRTSQARVLLGRAGDRSYPSATSSGAGANLAASR